MLKPGEVSERDDLRLARIDLLETRQRLVDGDEVGERRVDAHDAGVELDVFGAAPVLEPLVVSRALDQDAAHRERGGGKEMARGDPSARSPRSPATRRYASWTSAVGCSV